jgi:hypothetical protein
VGCDEDSSSGDDDVVLDIKGEVMRLVPIQPLAGTALVVTLPAAAGEGGREEERPAEWEGRCTPGFTAKACL